jgi:hypothetical protein
MAALSPLAGKQLGSIQRQQSAGSTRRTTLASEVRFLGAQMPPLAAAADWAVDGRLPRSADPGRREIALGRSLRDWQERIGMVPVVGLPMGSVNKLPADGRSDKGLISASTVRT